MDNVSSEAGATCSFLPRTGDLQAKRDAACFPEIQKRKPRKRTTSLYEEASLIITSNKPFGRLGDVFGYDVVAVAMIDRLIHADVSSLKADNYRLKDGDLGRPKTNQTTDT